MITPKKASRYSHCHIIHISVIHTINMTTAYMMLFVGMQWCSNSKLYLYIYRLFA